MKKYKAFTNSPVLVDPNDICNAVVGLKGTRVLHYQRQGPVAEIGIEQIIGEVLCPKCQSVARVKDRPQSFRDAINYGALDLSNAYAAVYKVPSPAPSRWRTTST